MLSNTLSLPRRSWNLQGKSRTSASAVMGGGGGGASMVKGGSTMDRPGKALP